jgi:hypothetical protein
MDSARLVWFHSKCIQPDRSKIHSARRILVCAISGRRAPFIRSRAAQIKTRARIDKTSLSIDTTPTLSEREESTFNFQPRLENDGNGGGKANLACVCGGLSISIRNCRLYTHTLPQNAYGMENFPIKRDVINNQRLLQRTKNIARQVLLKKRIAFHFPPFAETRFLEIFAGIKLL